MKLARMKAAYYKLVLMQSNGMQLADIKTQAEAEEIRPVLDPKQFSFDEAIEALLYQKSGRAKGKIIVRMKQWLLGSS